MKKPLILTAACLLIFAIASCTGQWEMPGGKAADTLAADAGDETAAADAEYAPGIMDGYNENIDREARSMEAFPYDNLPIMDDVVIHRNTEFESLGGETVCATEASVEAVRAYYTDILDDYDNFMETEDDTGMIMLMSQDDEYSYIVLISAIPNSELTSLTLNARRP